MNTTERKLHLESYQSAHTRLLQTLESLPKEMWKYKPVPEEWSVHEIIWHLADCEANFYVRARRIIAEPGSKVLAFDHDLWAAKLDYHKQSVEAALGFFKYLRGLNCELLQVQPENIWGNTVEHSQYGTLTLDQWLERADKHADNHIDQIKHNYELWLKRAQ
jgi:hypothetical protein